MWVNGVGVRMNGQTTSIDEMQAWNELDRAVESYYEGVE